MSVKRERQLKYVHHVFLLLYFTLKLLTVNLSLLAVGFSVVGPGTRVGFMAGTVAAGVVGEVSISINVGLRSTLQKCSEQHCIAKLLFEMLQKAELSVELKHLVCKIVSLMSDPRKTMAAQRPLGESTTQKSFPVQELHLHVRQSVRAGENEE